jgi:hypothetical protein
MDKKVGKKFYNLFYQPVEAKKDIGFDLGKFSLTVESKA